MLPDGMHRRSDLHTGVAFDNFDLFVETLTGKNTLHDTVGIVTQDIPDNDENLFNEQDETEGYEEDDIVPPKRRRRTYEVINDTMKPYHKQTKMLTESMLGLEDQRRALIPGSLQTARKLDFIWMASLTMEVPNTPMWTGWNSLSTPKDSLPQQRVLYLPQINASPTTADVVMETMQRSLRIADECDQQYISVTYDLAIAKIALSIQAAERPRFNKLFIQLGAFHIQLSFFKAVGKFIAESGGPYILTESGVLAEGSLNGFLNGKNYSRCNRIHSLFAVALEILHFKSFLKQENDSDEEHHIRRLLRQIEKTDRNDTPLLQSIPPEFDEIFQRYHF